MKWFHWNRKTDAEIISRGNVMLIPDQSKKKTGDPELFERKNGDFVKRIFTEDRWWLGYHCCGLSHEINKAPDLCPICGGDPPVVRIKTKIAYDMNVRINYLSYHTYYSLRESCVYRCDEIYENDSSDNRKFITAVGWKTRY